MADYTSASGRNSMWNHYRNVLGMPVRRRIVIAVLIIFTCFILFACAFTQIKISKRYSQKESLSHDSALMYVQSALNVSVDPCFDFYEFSCGLWAKDRHIEASEPRVTTFSLLQEIVNKKLRIITQQAETSDDLPRVVNDAIRYYNYCINAGPTNEADLNYLLNYLKQMGGWPILNGKDWNEDNFNWINASAFLIKTLSIHPVIRVYSTINDKNANQTVIYLTTPTMNENQMLLNLPMFQMLYAIILTLHQSPLNESEIYDNMLLLNETEVRWRAELNYSQKKPEFIVLTFKELAKKVPELDWLNYVQLVTNDTLNQINKKISEDDTVVINDYNYLRKAVNVLKSGTFSKREIADLFGWFTVKYIWNLIPGVLQEYAVLSGFNSDELKEGIKGRCFDKISDLFECSVDYLYVKNSSHSEVLDSRVLVGYLKKAFRNGIEKSLWLDKSTKHAALNKLDHMMEVIGFPKYLASKTEYDKMYENFPPTTPNILETYFKIKTYFVEMAVLQLKMPVDSQNWVLPRAVTDVSAYYIVQRNAIVFPISLHHPPFYYIHGPWYLNFGAIGTIIGHEIMHGFDKNGYRRDEYGAVKNWWSDVSLEMYKKHTKCFEDHYSIFKKTVVKYNDTPKTFDEDIADCEGLRVSYLAYKQWEKAHGVEKYPSENYTSDQMFFISYASVWCSKISPSMQTNLENDSHSLPNVRINAAVSNSKHFAEAFKCSKGSPMNPDRKCYIW